MLGIQLLFLNLQVKSFLQIPVLLLQDLEDGLFVLQFTLKVLGDKLELFDIALHVLQKFLLLLLLSVLFLSMLRFLFGHILLELVE